MAKGYPGVMVLGEMLVSAPLTPSVIGWGIPAGTSWREVSAALGAGEESSLDHLVEEARLHREVTAQLVAAQQRVAELTPLTEEAVNLQSQVAKAHRDADEAKKAFEALSARSWMDEKEAARVRKERDELLQRDADPRQWILDLLGEVEKERDLRLGAKEKLMALEKRASLDAAVVARLRKERDELLQTVERLRSKRGAAREEHDQAFREHDQAYQECDDAHQKVGSLQAKLESATTQKLGLRAFLPDWLCTSPR
ncbi:uncharacterized protein [Miscanthus floridulus]|uniref:uncharacterized protein n=1 Tax=Miscanthus floridulus TaxID=154761 RepID=UPI00345789F1